MAQVGGDKAFQSCLGPLVEAFEQGDGERILQPIVANLVVDRVGGELFHDVVGVGVIGVGHPIGLEDAAVVVEFGCMDETGHGNKLVFHPCRVLLLLGLLLCQQAVGLFLAAYLDAAGALSGGTASRRWFLARNLGIVGASAEVLLRALLLVFGLVPLAALFLGLLHGFLAGFLLLLFLL